MSHTRTALLATADAAVHARFSPMLQSLEYEVLWIQDGPGAISLCLSYPPEAVFLDHALPVTDGLAVAASLRRDPSVDDALPIALITGVAVDARKTEEARITATLSRDPAFHHLRELVQGWELAR
ncbi:MAG: response regulator [Candidatus Hydrogenedentota bacterium]